MRDITAYNQGDAAWRNKLMGTSGNPMWRFGCYVTGIASGLKSYFMKDIDPGKLCDFANTHDGFDEAGQIKYDVLKKLYPDVTFLDSAWTKNVPNANLSKMEVATALDKIKMANRRGQIVGICVDLIKNDGVTPDHYALAAETPDDLSQWTIMDPDLGKVVPFSQRYGSPLTGVYGYRIIGGTPANFPPEANKSDTAAGIAIGLLIDSRYSKKDVLRELI